MRLAAAAMLALAALSFALLWFLRGGGENPARLIEADVDEVRFAYPPAYARDAASRDGGAIERLALLAAFPGFAPYAPAKPAAAAPAGPVFITIRPRDDGLDPAERPGQLYAHFLQGDAAAGPGGLVIRRFEPGSLYELERLYVAPPEGRSFFARCLETAATEEADCLWLFRDGRLDVEVRFAPALLEHWPALASGARGFFAALKSGRFAKGAPQQRR